MNESKYLIAKYISDLRRVEPRNIGVILWTPSGTAARFLAEKPERCGEVDGRSIPPFVTSATAYKQWIEFWRHELENNEMESVQDSGKRASRSVSAFLDILVESNKGNFVLTEGGFLLDPIEDIDEAADFLFNTLVETNAQEQPRDVTLDEVCERLIEKSNLSRDANFHNGFPVKCEVETFEFSYAYRNGSIKRLYQRVPLSRQQAMRQKNVHDAAWMFERVTESNIVKRHDAVSLVFVPEGQSGESDVDRWLQVLNTVSRVVNVGDEQTALREFEGLPAQARHD
jgi:hypothetical protein